MPPVALLNLSGRYVGGEVALSWRFPVYAPDTVFVYPIYGAGPARRANPAEMAGYPLRDAASGKRFVFQTRSAHDVTRCEFLVFLGNYGEAAPDLDKLINNPAFTVAVTVGSATVFYESDTKKAEYGFEKHVITLQTDYSVEQGILGYSFTSCGRRFSVVFPGEIKRGKCRYPPFFTHENANVQVEVVSGTNSDVLAVAKRFSKLPFIR